MCMRESNEGCILLERQAKTEVKVNMLLGMFVVLIVVLSIITFKLLNTQIYLLSGERGFHVISDETRSDVKCMKEVSK